jgi:predicted RNase H-like HicB family nuclease/predicted RNA binding protein YcfA (HicA-like mRNA interferase family)
MSDSLTSDIWSRLSVNGENWNAQKLRVENRPRRVTIKQSMTYRVHLFQSEEGWAVSCPDLRGCHSQGQNREEALANIRDAIRLWLEAEAEENGVQRVEEAEVIVWPMPKIPGVNQHDAIRIFQKLGYRIVRQSGHVVMSNGEVRLTIPRHNPINAITMGAIAKDAGLTPEEFRALL